MLHVNEPFVCSIITARTIHAQSMMLSQAHISYASPTLFCTDGAGLNGFRFLTLL